MLAAAATVAAALLPARVIGVLSGSYIPAAGFSTHPFRGAVQSGGGSGMVLFKDGDEAVVLTVAHGYDLSSKTATQVLADKMLDGGLKQAFSAAQHASVGGAGYATSAGDPSIIAEDLGLWRHFQFFDSETCPLFNAGGHSGALDDPFGCDGVGPDIDLALQRIRLTPAAQVRVPPPAGARWCDGPARPYRGPRRPIAPPR